MTVSEDEKEKQKGYVFFFLRFVFTCRFMFVLVFFISPSSSGSLTTLYSLPWGFPSSSPPPSYSCWRLVELSKVDVFSLSLSPLNLSSHLISHSQLSQHISFENSYLIVIREWPSRVWYEVLVCDLCYLFECGRIWIVIRIET